MPGDLEVLLELGERSCGSALLDEAEGYIGDDQRYHNHTIDPWPILSRE